MIRQSLKINNTPNFIPHKRSTVQMLILYHGRPTDRFGKLSVRKALHPLQFSEGNFHLELS